MKSSGPQISAQTRWHFGHFLQPVYCTCCTPRFHRVSAFEPLLRTNFAAKSRSPRPIFSYDPSAFEAFARSRCMAHLTKFYQIFRQILADFPAVLSYLYSKFWPVQQILNFSKSVNFLIFETDFCFFLQLSAGNWSLKKLTKCRKCARFYLLAPRTCPKLRHWAANPSSAWRRLTGSFAGWNLWISRGVGVGNFGRQKFHKYQASYKLSTIQPHESGYGQILTTQSIILIPTPEQSFL